MPKKAVPLDVKGDTVTVVKSFPCVITAPPGADVNLPRGPEGVKPASADNLRTTNAAPNGTDKISVLAVTVTIDFEKKTKVVTKDTGEVEVVVGTPKPPDPPPPTGLAKALK